MYLTWCERRPFCLALGIKLNSLGPRNHIASVSSSSKQASISSTTSTSSSKMDSSSSYSSSLNTPLVPRYYVNEDSNSSMETHPPSPRFDDAILELDETFEFITPAMMGQPQAVPANEAETDFPQDDDEWSNDGVLSQVIDLQNLVEQRAQEEQQRQQHEVQGANSSLPSSSSSSSAAAAAASACSSSKNKKRKQDCVSSSTSSSSSSSTSNSKKKQKKQEKTSRTVPEPEPSTPPTGVVAPRDQGDWAVRRQLFPTPPTRRERSSSTTTTTTSAAAAPSGGSIEGIVPIHQSTQVADAQTQTTRNQDCPIRERSYVNITYELQAKENLYNSEPWRKVLSKARSDTSCRTYLVGGNLMLNHQLERNTLNVTGGWLNQPYSSQNNIPFQQVELIVFLNMLAQQDTSQPPQINHTIGDPNAKINIRLVSEGGVLKIIRRYRTIEVDISTPEKFRELKEDCLFALQVIEVLTERARQRRLLVEFLLRNPSPCDCTDGGAAHVHAYYYSPRVSDYIGILPLEFVYKTLSS